MCGFEYLPPCPSEDVITPRTAAQRQDVMDANIARHTDILKAQRAEDARLAAAASRLDAEYRAASSMSEQMQGCARSTKLFLFVQVLFVCC